MANVDLKECQQLCKDLEYLVEHNHNIREEVIDEYVYLLTHRRIVEMQEYVKIEMCSE